jgi:hypothetical protein
MNRPVLRFSRARTPWCGASWERAASAVCIFGAENSGLPRAESHVVVYVGATRIAATGLFRSWFGWPSAVSRAWKARVLAAAGHQCRPPAPSPAAHVRDVRARVGVHGAALRGQFHPRPDSPRQACPAWRPHGAARALAGAARRKAAQPPVPARRRRRERPPEPLAAQSPGPLSTRAATSREWPT